MNYDLSDIYREATITLKVTFLNEAIRWVNVKCLLYLHYILSETETKIWMQFNCRKTVTYHNYFVPCVNYIYLFSPRLSDNLYHNTALNMG